MSLLKHTDIINMYNLINKYTKLYIKKEFLDRDINKDIDYSEIKMGLNIANILSCSKVEEYRYIALKFATISAGLVEDYKILYRCNNILSRLSIFTFTDVLKNKKGYDTQKISSKGMTLFEKLYHEEYYSKIISGNKVKLNDFQMSISNAIETSSNISVSAPTSVGKSYIMKQIILETILQTKNSKVIYIVPTRALINEVMNDINIEIENLKIPHEILVTCTSEIKDDIKDKRCIFILTQERLNQLCSNVKNNLNMNLIVIDEAQKIADGSRGILLQYSIDRVKEIWPQIKVFFISPLIDNPDIFIKRFKLDNPYIKNENFSTVNQNIIYLNDGKKRSTIDIIYENEIIDSIRFTKTKYPNIPTKIAKIYKIFNNGENSIIYCNKQSFARKIVNELLKIEDDIDNSDKELMEFSDFLRIYINDSYDLAKLIKKGMAYHYSMLPSIIKIGIEDLAKKGKLKIITCTSTLLEGINIQANNIYIFNPQKKNNLLDNLEFWNLAGRAGRMKTDICGNIICINIAQNWVKDYSKKNIEDIEFSTNKILSSSSKDFVTFLENKNSINSDKIKEYNNLESYLMLKVLNGKSLIETYSEMDRYDEGNIQKIEDKIKQKINENKAPEQILKKLVGINTNVINELWDIFVSNYDNIERYHLLNPFAEDAIKRFDYILEIINSVFINNKMSIKKLKSIRKVAFKWIKEENMRSILFYDYNFENKDSNKINDHIEYRLDFLNQTIRYEISNYLFAYQEILKEVMILNGDEEKCSKLLNYPLYLEFGASKKKTLELMYLGIFREGAIILSKYIKSDETDKIYSELKNLNINSLDINMYIKNKLIDKINTI